MALLALRAVARVVVMVVVVDADVEVVIASIPETHGGGER